MSGSSLWAQALARMSGELDTVITQGCYRCHKPIDQLSQITWGYRDGGILAAHYDCVPWMEQFDGVVFSQYRNRSILQSFQDSLKATRHGISR